MNGDFFYDDDGRTNDMAKLREALTRAMEYGRLNLESALTKQTYAAVVSTLQRLVTGKKNQLFVVEYDVQKTSMPNKEIVFQIMTNVHFMLMSDINHNAIQSLTYTVNMDGSKLVLNIWT